MITWEIQYNLRKGKEVNLTYIFAHVHGFMISRPNIVFHQGITKTGMTKTLRQRRSSLYKTLRDLTESTVYFEGRREERITLSICLRS